MPLVLPHANPREAATQRPRFIELIHYLENLLANEPERFNLTAWLTAETSDDLQAAVETWAERHRKGEPLNCGTTACVYGHFPVIWPKTFAYHTNPRTDTMAKGTVVSRLPPAEGDYHSHEHEHAARWLGGTPFDWQLIFFPRYYDCEHPPLSDVLERLHAFYRALFGEPCPAL